MDLPSVTPLARLGVAESLLVSCNLQERSRVLQRTSDEGDRHRDQPLLRVGYKRINERTETWSTTEFDAIPDKPGGKRGGKTNMKYTHDVPEGGIANGQS